MSSGNGTVPAVQLAPAALHPDGFVRLSAVVEREVDWYWQGRVARANVVVVGGDGGIGKSTLVQALATGMTRGACPPGGVPGAPRNVVIMSAEEDTSAVIRPRMRLMGADLDRVTVLDIDALPLSLPSGGERLEARCRDEDAGMLIIDTGPSFMDPGLKSNSEEDIRRFLAPLRAVAERLRMVVIVLVHLNKDTTRSAGHRIMGGAAWRNVPRQVLLVGAPPGEDPRETPERLVVVEKNNLGAYPAAVSFRLAPAPLDASRAIVQWGNEVAGIRASDIVGEPETGEERSESEGAVEFLVEELSAGPRPAKELEAAAKDAGLAWVTVKRAKKRAGVESRKAAFGGHWEWLIPASTKGITTPRAPHDDPLDPLRENPHGIGDLEDSGARRGSSPRVDPLDPLRADPPTSELLHEGADWSAVIEATPRTAP